jgi:hypothetical protein
MFCLNCGAEYRQGFTRCSDCNVELVDASPKELSSDSRSAGNLVLLWAGDDLALHGLLLEELKAAGVSYFNRAISNYSLRAFPNRFPVSLAPMMGFEVSVLSSDAAKAQGILGKIARLS